MEVRITITSFSIKNDLLSNSNSIRQFTVILLLNNKIRSISSLVLK